VPTSDCEYPVPDEYERGALSGLILSGGSFSGRSTRCLRKLSSKKAALEHINTELGVWGASVDMHQDGDEQSRVLEAQFGYENAATKDSYRLTTRACPWLNNIEERPLVELELTPLAARILFSFRGNVHAKSLVVFRHRHPDGLAELLEAAGFNPSVVGVPFLKERVNYQVNE